MSRLSQQIVGAWELVSVVMSDVETGATSMPYGEHPKGFILYTPDGYMSAQIQHSGERSRTAQNDMFACTPDEYAAAARTYLAYSGPFSIDDDCGLRHEMAVSLFPNWTGQTQVRAAALVEDELRLSLLEPQLMSGALKDVELVWRRAPKQPSSVPKGKQLW